MNDVRTKRPLRRARWALVFAMAMVASLVAVGPAGADGSEALGPPSIPIAGGSAIAVAGTGLQNQPSTIDLAIPFGTTVNQVLIYWEGMSSTPTGDETIVVGGIEVTGALIGGPTFFFNNPFGPHYSSTYRADITGLGLVAPGVNSLSVEGLSFDQLNDGAGILAIYDDGTTAELGLFDGNDLAFVNFAPPLDTTAATTFSFAPEPIDRVATLSMFFSSVEGEVFPGDRPSVVEITVDGVVTELVNVLTSADGLEWDTLVVDVTVPAGVTEVTVQALSTDRDGTGNRPASLAWHVAGLSIPTTPPPPPGGGQGCTPGFWKQVWAGTWIDYEPTDDYEVVFGVDASFDKTLLGALKQGGGGEKALGRHAVAALLNSTNPGVSYEYTSAEVIALVQSAYANGNFNQVKNQLQAENESGCSIDANPQNGNGNKNRNKRR